MGSEMCIRDRVEFGEFLAGDIAFRVQLAVHFVAFISGVNIGKLASVEHRCVGNVIGVVAVRELLHHGAVVNHLLLSVAGGASDFAGSAACAAGDFAVAAACAASERASTVA